MTVAKNKGKKRRPPVAPSSSAGERAPGSPQASIASLQSVGSGSSFASFPNLSLNDAAAKKNGSSISLGSAPSTSRKSDGKKRRNQVKLFSDPNLSKSISEINMYQFVIENINML